MLRSTPKLLEVLMKLEQDSSKDSKTQLKNAKAERDLAQREVDSGFPMLHAWATFALWAHLESTIRIFIASWLKNKRSSLQVDPIQRLRIKIGEYESIPKLYKYEFIAELLERELAVGLRSGVNRFEKLLEPFGLSGDLPEIIKRTIYELAQVRNLIAHRASRVDRQFIQSCPWLNVQIGKNLYVSSNMFNKYNYASIIYILILNSRIKKSYKIDNSKIEQEIKSMLSILES